jgi:hypothetical protein
MGVRKSTLFKMSLSFILSRANNLVQQQQQRLPAPTQSSMQFPNDNKV